MNKIYKGGKVYYLNLTSVTTLVELVKKHLKCSYSESIRLIKNGGVKINQIQCTDPEKIFPYIEQPKNQEYVIHVGKHESFILLNDHYQLLPSEEIVLLKWQKQMETNKKLTKDIILNWEFKTQ